MLVVDAQVHIWANNKPTNPSHRQVTTFSKDDLLREMDEAGVDAAVIHPPATFCSFIQRGTVSSTVTPQITRVRPHSISVEPVA